MSQVTARYLDILFLVILFLLVGCSHPTQPAINPSPTTAPKSCNGPYTWAYGGVPPEFIDRVQAAMKVAGIEGTLVAGTFGENNDGCGYGAMTVDYTFTVQVASLDASTDLARVGASILEIATHCADPCPAPNLGKLQLVFRAKSQQCQWGYDGDSWNAQPGQPPDSITCPVPTSPESQQFADVLRVLSGDLACETSSVSANDIKAVLECSREEGKNRYQVTVTINLRGYRHELGCFHGYESFGNDTINMSDERERVFEWVANGIQFALTEQIKGGPELVFPQDSNEKVFARAVQAGLIPGDGQDCQ